uniref:Uncharacterized protein n=1 Tax=viral metagenome TaxID=1070528 RepID=A0A6C0ALT9_9ZZZZ
MSKNIMKKGQTWKDPETAIDIKIKSDRSSKGTYLMSINKPGYLPVIMRQKSLPTDEKTQDKMIQKIDGMLKKVANKTLKKNENVESIHVTPAGRTFRISETKKKKIDSKLSLRKTKKRKVIGNRGTVFTVYGRKSRKRRRKSKRSKTKRRKRTIKKRRK